MIGVVGISHKSAPLKIREKLAFDSSESELLARAILGIKYFKETIIISTCNRTEVYFAAEGICTHGASKNVQSLIVQAKGIDEDVKPYMFSFFHADAANHLFGVISGIDSMVLGEYQIVSQVKSSFNEAVKNQTAGKILHRLFTSGLNCSKQVRVQTRLNVGALSISYAAVEKCREQFDNLAERAILLIGTGDTGKLVLKNLVKKGCRNIMIANRTHELAQELSACYPVNPIPFDNLGEGIHHAEIIISSVSCKDPILDASTMKSYLNGHEKLLVIDLGVPRNINPDVATIPGTTLLNVDDLNGVIDLNNSRKEKYVTIADQIIKQHVTIFTNWLSEQNLSPIIKKIEKKLHQLFERELNNYRDNLHEEELEQIAKFNLHMANKIKKAIVKQLKVVTRDGRDTEFVGAMNQLFENEER